MTNAEEEFSIKFNKFINELTELDIFMVYCIYNIVQLKI